MIRKGDTVPDIELRTDEGTPISLADLGGRALAVFLLGPGLEPGNVRLLEALARHAVGILELHMSPVAVVGETVERLAEHRERDDVPYLLFSDVDLKLHRALRGDDGERVGVWMVDADGKVVDILPVLPPEELVALTLQRAKRAAASERRPVGKGPTAV